MSYRWLVLFVAALSSAHAEADSSPSKIEGGRAMKSSVTKHSVHPAGHKTSVSLEDAFWNGLKEIADGRYITSSELIAEIDAGRQHGNLSSAVRLFVLDFYRYRLLEEAEDRSERASPPLVPSPDGDVFLVLCQFSKSGATFIETPADTNEGAIVRNMIGGQYNKPLRVIAINVGEGWARDVSKRIASVIVKEAERDERTLPRDTGAFVEAQLGRPVRR